MKTLDIAAIFKSGAGSHNLFWVNGFVSFRRVLDETRSRDCGGFR